MNELRTKMNNLTDWKLDYVIERSKARKDSDGYSNAGISKSTFYSLEAEEREYLNELAQQLKRETSYRAIMVLEDATEEAARVKVAGLQSRNENVKQGVATEILDRQLGKATQRTEVSGAGGSDTIVVRLVKDD